MQSSSWRSRWLWKEPVHVALKRTSCCCWCWWSVMGREADHGDGHILQPPISNYAISNACTLRDLLNFTFDLKFVCNTRIGSCVTSELYRYFYLHARYTVQPVSSVFHCTPPSTTTSTHFCCFSCLHRRCTYCVELNVCKHSMCWQRCEF